MSKELTGEDWKESGENISPDVRERIRLCGEHRSSIFREGSQFKDRRKSVVVAGKLFATSALEQSIVSRVDENSRDGWIMGHHGKIAQHSVA